MSTFSPISTCPSCNAFTADDEMHCNACGAALASTATGGGDDLTPLALADPDHEIINPFAVRKKTESQFFPPEPPKTVLSIFSFQGRSSRQEYWLTTLVL